MKIKKYIFSIFTFLIAVLIITLYILNKPKPIISFGNYNISKLISELPPIDQGGGCPDGKCPETSQYLYQKYLKDIKNKCCVIKQITISKDKIDINKSISISIELLNISHIDN